MANRRFLIMSASIGSGHIRAAEALQQEILRQDVTATVQAVDFMDRKISLLNWLLKECYLKMLAIVPNIYDLLYQFSGGDSGGSFIRSLLAWVMAGKMNKLLDTYQPDVVICTHPFPEGAAALLKRRGRQDFRLVVTLTDFCLHEIWYHKGVDVFFTATEEMRQGLASFGFAAENIHACGIPVNGSIMNTRDRAVLRREYGVPAEAVAVLLMGGGLGLGSIGATMDELERVEKAMVILVVAGHNKGLEQQARSRAASSHHKVMVWGYTDKVYELMQMSDMLISKPGALTISEAFILGLPMLLREPIPGPETENAMFTSGHGAALWLHHGDSLAEAVAKLAGDRPAMTAMSERARACAKPLASQRIIEAINKHC